MIDPLLPRTLLSLTQSTTPGQYLPPMNIYSGVLVTYDLTTHTLLKPATTYYGDSRDITNRTTFLNIFHLEYPEQLDFYLNDFYLYSIGLEITNAASGGGERDNAHWTAFASINTELDYVPISQIVSIPNFTYIKHQWTPIQQIMPAGSIWGIECTEGYLAAGGTARMTAIGYQL